METQRCGEEGPTRTEAEAGALQLQVERQQDRRQPQALGEARQGLPQKLQREHGHADTLTSGFWPPEL